MSQPHPELFDLPGDYKQKRIFKAVGTIGKGKQSRRVHVWVQASTERIANRVGKAWLRDVHKATITMTIPCTWEEYGREFRNSGVEIGPPLPPRFSV